MMNPIPDKFWIPEDTEFEFEVDGQRFIIFGLGNSVVPGFGDMYSLRWCPDNKPWYRGHDVTIRDSRSLFGSLRNRFYNDAKKYARRVNALRKAQATQ